MPRTLLTACLLLAILLNCKKEVDPKSAQKQLLTFSFQSSANPVLPTAVDAIIVNNQITLTLPPRTAADALKATFMVSLLATVTVDGVTQQSGVTVNNFTKPVIYRITAEDGSLATYTVTVSVAKSGDKVLSTFAFLKTDNPTLPADLTATISTAQISTTLPTGVQPNALKASFTLSPSATVTANGVKQQSGVTVNDFTNPLTYVVTAEDGTSQSFTVTVYAAPKSSEKQITGFSFATLTPVVSATIDQATRKITATVPGTANLTALAPTITLSPKATVSPASGVAQNFTTLVSYTVTAEDGSSQIYQVTIDKNAVTAVPSELGLSPFYKKYVDASGIPVVSSAKVPDAALVQARNTINQLLEKIPAVVAKMKLNKMRVAIMAESEVTIDIPEHSDLYTAFPGTDWNTRARGLGATLQRPACSCAEENLLCYPSDRYLGEDILVHEFAHGIHQLGIDYVDSSFDKELESVYKEALAKGLWANTYAATNYIEYWAEGVQDWFDLNKEAIPTNTVHNQINTREELRVYDSKLYELISRYFNVPTRKVSCQAGK